MNVLKKLGLRVILASVGMALAGSVMASAAAASPAAPATTDAVANGTTLNAAGSDFTAQATKHKWHSYDGFNTVYAYGWYTRTSKRSAVYGHIRDSRSGRKYAGIYLKWTEPGKNCHVALVNPNHHTTASFRKIYVCSLTKHLYVAETLNEKIGGKWKIVTTGKLHKIY